MTTDSSAARILVVDDSLPTLEVIRRNLEAQGHTVTTVTDVPAAVDALSAQAVDLVITDLKMPRVSGLDLVRHVRENHPDTEVMMITGYATVEGAVEAMKSGAEEYLTKPFTDDELCRAVDHLLDRLALRRNGKAGSGRQAASSPRAGSILGESHAIRRAVGLARRAAQTDATILVTGESGTGKELLARTIHYESPRSTAPFVPVNCGAVPETLLESELFGHVKGAFTGADTSRAGFFQTADDGTVFLDEIGETTPNMQVKLLRVLQEREVTMVGSNKPRPVNVRVIAATNKDLARLIQTGAFREDLYYRINVIEVRMPPLRERGDDVLVLAHHFARKYGASVGATAPEFTPEALAHLRRYPWPGNVRELENVVQRMVVMSEDGTLDVPDLPAPMRFQAGRGGDGPDLRSLAEVEAGHIRQVLAAVGSNRTRAAKILGIDRKTLRKKITDYDLDPDTGDDGT
jgi:two-component system response regulator HydG